MYFEWFEIRCVKVKEGNMDQHKLFNWMFVAMIGFYFIGFFFIPSSDLSYVVDSKIMNTIGHIHPDEEGDYNIDDYSIELKGIGKILTYKELYITPMLLCIWFIIAGVDNKKSVPFMVSIIGILLIYLTTRDKIIPTVCFWLSLIALYISIRVDVKMETKNNK